MTLTTTQSFGVTSSNAGGSSRNGTWVDAAFVMTFTSNGSAGNAITVATSLPAPTLTLRAGGFAYSDVGTGVYEGSVFINSSGTLTFFVHNSAFNNLGQTPSFAIATNDVLYINLRYPVI